MKTSFRHILLVAALASLSSMATAADLADGVSRRVVRYGDLDLTRIEGVKALYARISHSARDASDQVNSRSLVAQGGGWAPDRCGNPQRIAGNCAKLPRQ